MPAIEVCTFDAVNLIFSLINIISLCTISGDVVGCMCVWAYYIHHSPCEIDH